MGLLSRRQEPTTSPQSSDDIVADLSAVAFVDIFNYERTGKWSAVATMRIKAVGAEFKVRTDHNHPSMFAALVELQLRVRDVLRQQQSRNP